MAKTNYNFFSYENSRPAVCGNTEIILNKMLKTGADAFELDNKTDVQKGFAIYHDKATLIGNIDPSGVLVLGAADRNLTAMIEVAREF